MDGCFHDRRWSDIGTIGLLHLHPAKPGLFACRYGRQNRLVDARIADCDDRGFLFRNSRRVFAWQKARQNRMSSKGRNRANIRARPLIFVNHRREQAERSVIRETNLLRAPSRKCARENYCNRCRRAPALLPAARRPAWAFSDRPRGRRLRTGRLVDLDFILANVLLALVNPWIAKLRLKPALRAIQPTIAREGYARPRRHSAYADRIDGSRHW
jgi:hypothetical protein